MSAGRVAIDPWALAPRFQHHGTNVYAHHLIAELRKIAKDTPDIEVCVLQPDSDLFWSAQDDQPASRLMGAVKGNGRLWRLGGASRAARSIGADVLFSPSCNIYPSLKMPTVCTIHDVTPIVMPSHSTKIVAAQRFFLRSACRRSAAIITVSECSRSDIAAHCGVAEEKVTVVYNGYDQAIFNSDPVDPELQNGLRKRLGIRQAYIFHHGVIQPRKNLRRLIDAHAKLLARHSDLHLDLVLVGTLGWNYEKIASAAREAISERGRVILAGTLEDGELALLLKGASLVVIPSLYEGFCLPMVEAMACGVPTVASNSSCLPEISGNALRYFDPLSTDEITRTMESVLFNEELTHSLVRNGLVRARAFSWEKCACETLDVLLRAAQHPIRQLAGAAL